MARIRKCDRCGETYTPYETGFNTVEVSTYNMDNECEGTTTTYDLCPKCKTDFTAWFQAHGAKVDE
jgi:hypothetical protein